jgi:outer membrane biogenesis lipoprotein LolB
MKIHFLLLGLTLLISACAHHGQRDPASVKQEQETAHEKHQGIFDRPY